MRGPMYNIINSMEAVELIRTRIRSFPRNGNPGAARSESSVSCPGTSPESQSDAGVAGIVAPL